MSGPSTSPIASPDQLSVMQPAKGAQEPINLRKGERGLLVGATGTGKSTLAEELLNRFQLDYPKGCILIFDSKPRFRASFGLNGVAMKYRGFVAGAEIPGSVAIAAENIRLKVAFQQSRVIIFQSTDHKGDPVDGYQWRAGEYADEFFRFAGPTRPCLLYCDELYDELSGLAGIADSRLLRTIRSGRERNLAVLAASQRPRSIPIPILSEADNYYLFQLRYEDDRKQLAKFGPPTTLQPVGHQFLFYRNKIGGTYHESIRELQVK